MLPDESTLKYKACYCVQRDIQTEDVDYFKTYATVVQWSTIHLALTMIINNNWHTKQVYYTNAFDQEYLRENAYIYPLVVLENMMVSQRCLESSKFSMGLLTPPKNSLISSRLVSLNGNELNQNYNPVSSWNLTWFFLFMWTIQLLMVPKISHWSWN